MKPKNKKLFTLTQTGVVTLLFVSSFMPVVLLAQTTPTPPTSNQCGTGFRYEAGVCIPDTIGPRSDIKTISQLILALVNILLALVGLIAVIFLIWGGYLYVTARGNEEQEENAKKTIWNAVIGLIIVIFAFVVVRVIANALTRGNLPGNL